MKIVLDLRTMLVGQGGNGLQLQQDFVVTNEVGHILFLQRLVLVSQSQRNQRLGRNTLQREFDLETLLIDCLEKPTALLAIHVETCTKDFVGFFLLDKFAHAFSPSECSVYSVG